MLQRGNALGDAPRHRFAPRRSSQDRTQSVQKGVRRGASHDSLDYRSSRSSVGMPWVTLRVRDLHRAAVLRIGRRGSRTACDAERRTIVKPRKSATHDSEAAQRTL
ncbi:DUF1534 domain-containing protein [Pseudomonas savastanoi]|nr:DUF1534 domain-containing protein [Pseudomonas savastanoi]